MTTLLTEPQLVETAAANVAEIRSEISEAKAAAAGPTTGLAAAAQDEVSAATAKLFGAYAQEYQSVLTQAGAFHEEFAAALASAGNAYAAAEAANASAISRVAPTLTSAVVQPPLQGTTIGLIMGGSGLPIPPPSYVSAVLNYVNHNFNVSLPNAQALFTPEGYYPLILKSLPLDPSISQGLQILDTAIKQQLATPGVGSVAVLGYSQSADISSLEMLNLANPMLNPNPPTANQLGFTLLGDQMNPNGGFFARFPGFPAGQPLQLPALGLTLYGATPSNTIYPTNIFTLEYDGWADFPQYPINVVSDLNAFAGIAFVHGTYPSLNPSALPPGYALQQLPTSPGYTGVTNYYMITTPNGLPLLGSGAGDTGHRQPTRGPAATGSDHDRESGLREPQLWLFDWTCGRADLFRAVPPRQPGRHCSGSDRRSPSGNRRLRERHPRRSLGRCRSPASPTRWHHR